MMQSFACGGCGKTIGAELPAGSRVMCPYCRQVVQVPGAAPPVPGSVPPSPVAGDWTGGTGAWAGQTGAGAGFSPNAAGGFGAGATGFGPGAGGPAGAPAVMPYSAGMYAPVSQGAAITALVLSLVGIGAGLWPVGIAGGIVGIVALKKINREPHRYGGRGMAVAGIVIGGVCLLLTMAVVGFLLFFWSTISGGITALDEQVTCEGQLAQVAAQMAMYEQEHGVYPDSLETLVATGTLSVVDVTCPGAVTGGTSYHYVPGFSSAAGAARVVAFDDPLNHWDGGHVVYADGRVVWLDDPQFTAVIRAVRRPDGTAFEMPSEEEEEETEEAEPYAP